LWLMVDVRLKLGFGGLIPVTPGQKLLENRPKKRPNFVTAGAPGRGVLRFWGGGIQESRSFFGLKWPKNRKSVRLRG